MTSIAIFQDVENVGDERKVKEIKGKSIGPTRNVLGVINNKNDNIKSFFPSKSSVTCEIKDEVSEAFKSVKLDSNDVENEDRGKVRIKERLPLNEIRTEDKQLSPVELDEPSPIRVGTPEPLHVVISKQKLEELYTCTEYRNDIYGYLRGLETKFKPAAYYMKRQPDITYKMRTILIDWLVEVADEYKLLNETLFMAVSYVDRFLSTMAVVRGKLQLLGSAAMLVASKYEEIYPPEVGEFTYITDDSYTKKQMLRMEHLILKTLTFDLAAPTTITFITHLSVMCKLEDTTTFLAMYLCELTLLEGDPYLGFAPSRVACAAIALARHCLGEADVWPTILARASMYSLRQLVPVINHLNSTHSNASTSPHTAIRDKYKSRKFHHVSAIQAKQLIIRDPTQSP